MIKSTLKEHVLHSPYLSRNKEVTDINLIVINIGITSIFIFAQAEFNHMLDTLHITEKQTAKQNGS